MRGAERLAARAGAFQRYSPVAMTARDGWRRGLAIWQAPRGYARRVNDREPLCGLAGGDAPGAAGTAAARWSALHDAASVVATLAGCVDQHTGPGDFPRQLAATHGWRKALAETAVDDLAAVMEPGIAALLAVHARGASSAAAAQALWQEFVNARAALLALVVAEA